MSDTEKNTPVLPEVEAEIRMESNSITDNSIGESEQLVKSEHDLFGTEGEPGNQNASGNSGSGRLWPGFYPQHPFGQGLPVVVFNDDTLRTSLTTWSAQVLAAAHNGLDAHRRVYRLGSAMARVDVSDGSGEARSELLDKDGVWGVLARSARWARVKQVERANGKKSYQLHEVNAPGKHLLDLKRSGPPCRRYRRQTKQRLPERRNTLPTIAGVWIIRAIEPKDFPSVRESLRVRVSRCSSNAKAAVVCAGRKPVRRPLPPSARFIARVGGTTSWIRTHGPNWCRCRDV